MFATKAAKPGTKKAAGATSQLAHQHAALTARRLFPRSASPRDVRRVLDESGQPLDTGTLRYFRTRLGYDFSSVRVHADHRAADSAASLSARAYAVGRHVVFGRGEYAPESAAGRHLLGHELAHVVQQARGGSTAPGSDSRSLEGAAEYAANQASRGARVAVAGSSAIAIACKTLFQELSNGAYIWDLLKGALEHARSADDIVDDINGLTAAERAQAIKDTEKELGDRQREVADFRAKRATQKDPDLQSILDSILQDRERVLTKIFAVLSGLKIPGWNFRPGDFAKLQAAGQGLTMAPDSGWFPARLQENLRKTLEFVLDPQRSPSATEGVNAVDFFHGHMVVKKDKTTDKQVKAVTKRAKKVTAQLEAATTKSVGEVKFGKRDPLADPKKIPAYQKVLESIEPAHASVLEDTAKIPGAAVMYHTFEFKQPSDLKAKGQTLDPLDPRRHFVTPLDTNAPRQYTPPAPDTYEKEFTHVARFAFLIDDKGAVHVRPFEMTGSFLTHELSTITGSPIPDTMDFEK